MISIKDLNQIWISARRSVVNIIILGFLLHHWDNWIIYNRAIQLIRFVVVYSRQTHFEPRLSISHPLSIKAYPKTYHLCMILTFCHSIKHIWFTQKTFQTSRKGRNTARFLQLVMTSLCGVWFGNPVISI